MLNYITLFILSIVKFINLKILKKVLTKLKKINFFTILLLFSIYKKILVYFLNELHKLFLNLNIKLSIMKYSIYLLFYTN